jgi:hypothetical protein
MTKIDPYSLTTVPLEPLANGKSIGRATGFIWRRRSQHYLITNWHVVTGRDAVTGGALSAPARPDMLRAYFNTKAMNYGKVVIDLSIRDADHNPLWYIEAIRRRKDDNELSPAPFGPKGCDVVAMPLAVSSDTNIGLYPINDLKSEHDLAVRIGMDVFILGYPFGHQSPGFPVWKRGSIASEPDLTNIGTGYTLVDTASRPGMSGSPVILRSWGTHMLEHDAFAMDKNSQSKFVGVYSGRLRTNDKEDAQLGVVWPASDIENIIDAAKYDH